MDRVTVTKQHIRDNNLAIEFIEHEGDGMTSQQAAVVHNVTVSQIIKTLLFVDKDGKKMIVILPGDRKVDVKKLPGMRKPDMANKQVLHESLRIDPGGVPPIGLPVDLPKVVDENVLKMEVVYGSGGSRFTGIKLSPQLLLKEPNTQVLAVAK